MARKATLTQDIRRLFALSGNQCAFPDCQNRLINGKGNFIGQVCHINAANEGGERFIEEQTDEERRSFENLLLMCYEHHIETNDVTLYPSDALIEMKRLHETKFINIPYTILTDSQDRIIKDFTTQFDKLFALASETLEKVNQTNETSLQILDVVIGLQGLSGSNIHAKQLEFIKEFRKDKKPQTALTMLLKYKEDHWGEINDELRYKVLANLGGLLFDLGRNKEGAEYLVKINELGYKSTDSIVFQCLGLSILGRRAEYFELFEEVKAIAKNNANLWLSYIRIQDGHLSFEDIKGQVPVEITNKPEIVFALGEVLLSNGYTDEGFKYLENALRLVKGGIEESWHIMSLIEAKRLIQLITPTKLALKQFSHAERATIEKSIEVLSTILDYVSQTELINSAWHVILNRGIANHALERNIEAGLDFEEAWRISKNFIAFRDLLLHYIDSNLLAKAEALIAIGGKADFSNQDQIELVKCEARVLGLLGRIDSAVNVLISKIGDADREDQLRLLDLIILIYFDQKAYDKALQFALQIVRDFADSHVGYLATGVCYRGMGQRELAISNLNEALSRIDDDIDNSVAWVQLGEEFGNLNESEKAILCLEKIASSDGFDRVHRRLLREYFQIGEVEKAIALARTGLALCPGDPFLYQILIHSHYNFGDHENTRNVLEEALKYSVDDSLDHFRLLGAKFYSEIGEEDKSIELCLAIRNPEKFHFRDRYIIASILLQTDVFERGLEIAYDTRIDNYPNPEAHEMFIQAQAGKREQENYVSFPRTVSMECAVSLVNKAGEVSKYFITDDPRLQGTYFLKPSDTLAELLLGKEVGSEINLANNIGVGSILKIREIQNKYVYAFQDSLMLLEKNFTGETGFKVLKWEGDGFEELTNFIKGESIKSQQNVRTLFEMYSDGIMTVGMLASGFHKNFIETWLALSHTNDTFLECYAHNEGPIISDAITEGKLIVLDPISLLSNFILLRDYNLLDGFTTKYVVASSTLTQIKRYRQELQSSGPSFSVGVQDGEVRRFEDTKENIENTIRVLDSIVSWCETNAQIRAAQRIFNSNRGKKGELGKMIGQEFHDTLLIAKELSGTLLSDDARLKRFANDEFQVAGFSTYQLAIFRRSEGILTGKEFEEVSNILIKSNYAFLPVVGNQLWELLLESNFQLKYPFIRGVRGLRIMSIPHCAKALVDFFKLLYVNMTIDASREPIVLYVLQAAKRNPYYSSVKPMLLRLVAMDFYLIPQHSERLIDLIQTLPVQQ